MKRHDSHTWSMRIRVVLAVGVVLMLLLGGCVAPPEGPSEPEPGANGVERNPLTDRGPVDTVDDLALKYHRFDWEAPCPPVPEPDTDEPHPRLRITPTNTTFVAGDIQCFTVSFTNTADEPLEYTPPSGCRGPVLTLMLEGMEDTTFLPLNLRQQDTIPCSPPIGERMVIEPGQRLSTSFVWDGTVIIDGFGPPFLSAGTYPLVARLPADTSWNVTARLNVTILEDPDHPTRPCRQVSLDTSIRHAPNMQIRLDQTAYRADEWFCIPLTVYNGGDRSFNVTTPTSCLEPDVRFIPQSHDQKPIEYSRRTLCFQAVTTHTLEPGESWSWLYWWPALDHRGGEHLLQVGLAGTGWDATEEQVITIT